MILEMKTLVTLNFLIKILWYFCRNYSDFEFMQVCRFTIDSKCHYSLWLSFRYVMNWPSDFLSLKSSAVITILKLWIANITKANFTVKYIWVTAHKGIKFNQTVVRLAKGSILDEHVNPVVLQFRNTIEMKWNTNGHVFGNNIPQIQHQGIRRYNPKM